MTSKFDGIDDFIEIGQKSIPTSGDWSIAFWMQSGSNQTALAVPLSQGHFNTTGITFQFQSFNVPNLSVGPRSSGEQMIIDEFASSDTGWHHVTLTHDDSTLENILYLDGVVANVHAAPTAGAPTVTSWMNDFIDSGHNLRFGNDAQITDRFWDGLLDEIRIYDSVLIASEVAELANTTAIPEPSSLALLATGAIGLIGYQRRRRKQAA